MEAILYERLDGYKVRCNVCHHHCVISESKRGICGVRENNRGVLYALNYGLCVANSIDPIEKKPLYEFLPNTFSYSFSAAGCNLDCKWCQNYTISQQPKKSDFIIGETLLPLEHVNLAIKNHCPSISYTYSEPTIFIEYALETMKLARKFGLKNIWVTNGYMSDESLEILLPLLDAANVDYKGNNSVYKSHCGGNGEEILNNIKKMIEHNVHVEVTTLIIPGVNHEPEQFKEICTTLKKYMPLSTPWHLTRFFPTYKMKDAKVTSRQTMYNLQTIAEQEGFTNLYLGNM